MKIIDFEKKGNVVRFWLGDDDCNDYWGDDWNDVSWEHNAGNVYHDYIRGYKDISFPFEWDVCDSSDGISESGYCKEDMKNMKVPCIVAAPEDNDSWWDDFSHVSQRKNCIKYYFNDPMEPDHHVHFEGYNMIVD